MPAVDTGQALPESAGVSPPPSRPEPPSWGSPEGWQTSLLCRGPTLACPQVPVAAAAAVVWPRSIQKSPLSVCTEGSAAATPLA